MSRSEETQPKKALLVSQVNPPTHTHTHTIWAGARTLQPCLGDCHRAPHLGTGRGVWGTRGCKRGGRKENQKTTTHPPSRPPHQPLLSSHITRLTVFTSGVPSPASRASDYKHKSGLVTAAASARPLGRLPRRASSECVRSDISPLSPMT